MTMPAEGAATGTEAPPAQDQGGAPPAQGAPAGASSNGQPAAPPAEDDGWDVEVPEGEYIPRGTITEARNRYANERKKRLEYEKSLEEWGGADTVKQALDWVNWAQTEEGAVDLWVQLGQKLGLGIREMEALFKEGEAAGAAGAGVGDEVIADDQVITMAEARKLIEQELREKVEAPRTKEQQVTQAREAVSTVLNELGVDDQTDAGDILQLGDKYLPAGSMDPKEIAAAVRKGYADWERLVGERAQAYVKKRAELNGGVPKAPAGGGAPANPPPEPPKDVEEAKRRVREKIRAAGSS